MKGRLIALEGGEAVGKSTQARILAERLGAVHTREPGATELGEAIRSLVLDSSGLSLSSQAEALLMAADRAQHVAEVIRPALEDGTHVVTDRFIGSSLAYQGIGRDLGVEEVLGISLFATGGLNADLVILLEAGDKAAQSRLGLRQRFFWRDLVEENAEKIEYQLALPDDRIGSEDLEFHQRVLQGYRMLAEQHPDRWVVIDGTCSVEEVAEAVYDAVREKLGV
ncbi:MAG: dTMP kinase [bacterium]|nr:dTMP kinase [bacterium]MDE0215829.1 dTMP kinase [bacterium]